MDAYILGGRPTPPGVNVRYPFSLMRFSLHILEEAKMEVSGQRRHAQVRYQRRENWLKMMTFWQHYTPLATFHIFLIGLTLLDQG